MKLLPVIEIFESIQGESTYAGLPCLFIRLASCNLSCSYCDTDFSMDSSKGMTIDEIMEQVKESSISLVELTGGEPLLHSGSEELMRRVAELPGRKLLVETNGTQDISTVPMSAVAVIDVKCPGSGQLNSFDMLNLERLRPQDQLKFVLCDRADYEWALDFVRNHDLAQKGIELIAGPVYDALRPGLLASWIMDDLAPFRIQIQLHKLLGVR